MTVATEEKAKLLFHVALIASTATSYCHMRERHSQGKLQIAIVSLPMRYAPEQLQALVVSTLDVLATQPHMESHLDGVGILLGGCEDCQIHHLAIYDPSLTQEQVSDFIEGVHSHEKRVNHLENSLSSDPPTPTDEA